MSRRFLVRAFQEFILSDRFVVEADRRVVGVAVRTQGGFRFFTSDPHFQDLEGKVFRRFRSVRGAIERLAAKRRQDIQPAALH